MYSAVWFVLGLGCAVIYTEAGRCVSSTTKAGESTGEIPPQENRPRPGATDERRKKRATCSSSAYRTADGTCNNEANTDWGSIDQAFLRQLDPVYDDGEKLPRALASDGDELPSPREIATTVHFHLNFTATTGTLMRMEWGQFLAHDIVSTPVMDHSYDCCDGTHASDYLTGGECFPITIPSDDWYFTSTCMNFTRSDPATTDGTENSPRNQYNAITAFIDASNVYGSSDTETAALRSFTGGLLLVEANDDQTEPNDLLPNLGETDCDMDSTDSTNYCFTAGDSRVNVFPGLNALHTLFMREHNRIATELADYQTTWDDETLFQEARKIVGAEMQVITYRQWLPRIIGDDAVATYGLEEGSYAYDSSVNPTLSNVFATAAFRFGHTMLPETVNIAGTDYDLVDLFYRTKFVRDSLDDVISGLLITHMQRVDAWYVEGMTNHLFETDSSNGLDIVSLNIQRGRDHGLPPLNDWRVACGLDTITNFTGGDFGTRAGVDLSRIYTSTDDIDMYSGAVSEESVLNGNVGPTYACLLGYQFKNLKVGDRYFYESTDTTTGFSSQQLREVMKTSLARVICDNTGITSIQKNVFKAVSDVDPESSCTDTETIRKMDLSRWE